ncbi:MAG: TonB-dependent receptor [Flavobacteriales bacterium]|nr:TonB-dependent receptor [Flavobacteriales bacterium]
MKKIIFLAATIFATANCIAQYSVYGTVQDSLSNPIVGATVRILNTYKGVSSDNNGNFRLNNLSAGNYQLEVSFVGYQSHQINVENLAENREYNVVLKESRQTLDELIVSATRVKENSPIAHNNISYQDIEKNNLGQDIPFLLQNEVSVVSTSDAGAGVGYTGFRIRGSDATRINVTVNGIPINDAESQGTFWVNMPDFASSTENIQIQRGVGSSTNGAGAFGGTVNLQTTTLKEKAYGEIASSYGSFNTQKYTAKFGTGLINNHWAFDARASYITSDGYIDRATSDLRSYYLSGGYYGKNTSLKLVYFAGKEITYQSWWGTPESRITGNKEDMETHAANNGLDSVQTFNLLNSGRTYNYYQYKNEVDNYGQDHAQLLFTHQFSSKLSANAALHYTYGRGYYEQFRKDDNFASYGLNDLIVGNDTILSTDLIRRRWLDNHFYGATYNLSYNSSKLSLILGGGYNNYDGRHFGELIWMRFANNTGLGYRWYDNDANKRDLNTFLKADYLITEKITLFADLQVRTVDYSTKGKDNDLRILSVDTNFVFFNPKGGLSYQMNEKTRFYASLSVGNREPVRGDFIDNPANKQPKHETMLDYEAGVDVKLKKALFQANFYYMDYKNQLILTGELNDVGSSIRTNVDKSYRAGVEFSANFLISKKVTLGFNTTLSQNKIDQFTEVIYDYTDWNEVVVVENKYKNTDIAFSPNIIAAGNIVYMPAKGLSLMLQTKYVGKQFLDNTSNAKRVIDAYKTVDGRLSYSIYPKKMREISFNLLVNNMLNSLYSSNGYTYSYIYEKLITENFYYPQAGTNFLLGLTFKF